MVVVFWSGLGSYLVQFLCSNIFISGIDCYMRRVVFRSLKVYFMYRFCIGCIILIVLWDNMQVAFLQLLACKEPPCDGVSQKTSQVSGKYRELTHWAAQALLQLWSHSAVCTALLVCHQQCQRTPLSVPPDFHAERSSPQSAGDLNTLNYIVLNTLKLRARRI